MREIYDEALVEVAKPGTLTGHCAACREEASAVLRVGSCAQRTLIPLCDEHAQEVVDRLSNFFVAKVCEERGQEVVTKYADKTDDELNTFIEEKRR